MQDAKIILRILDRTLKTITTDEYLVPEILKYAPKKLLSALSAYLMNLRPILTIRRQGLRDMQVKQKYLSGKSSLSMDIHLLLDDMVFVNLNFTLNLLITQSLEIILLEILHENFKFLKTFHRTGNFQSRSHVVDIRRLYKCTLQTFFNVHIYNLTLKIAAYSYLTIHIL